MAKIARTPFNGARWLTKFVTSSVTISKRSTGQCLFVTAAEALDLNIDFIDKGSYFKIIFKETTAAEVTITLPSVAGVVVCDAGGASMVEGTGETIIIPSGATEASYLDLLCDGEKWYCQGMVHGVTASIS
jgi:hypothetical protein